MQQKSSSQTPMSDDTEFSDPPRDGWVNWFDAAATLVEHLRLIVGGTLLVGALALAVSFVLPRTYTSISYLGPLEDAEAKTVDSIMHSPRVLNDALAKFPEYYAAGDLARRRDYLSENLQWRIAKGANPKLALYKLEFTDNSPGRAQALLKVIIDRWIATTAPPPDTRAKIENALKANEEQIKDLTQVIDALKNRRDLLTPDVKGGYLPPNIGEMIKLRTQTEAGIDDLKAQLKTKSRDIIFEAPDLPSVPSGPRRALIVGVSMTVALGLLIAFTLLLHFLQMAAERPAYASFFERIGQAVHRR
jgi:LPS O-antigen subunit length determinant protein (WzzB/FepE family)